MPTRLKTILGLRKITHEELAEMTGLSRKTVARAANGGKVNKATRNIISLKLGDAQEELFAPENIPTAIIPGSEAQS